MGDKESYKAVNRQALDAFGYSFSMGAAIFCVSIWPMPFSLAWLHCGSPRRRWNCRLICRLSGHRCITSPRFCCFILPVRMIYSLVMRRLALVFSL